MTAKLVEDYYSTAIRFAKSALKNVDRQTREECAAYSVFGLMRAAETFDPDMQVSFETYMYPWAVGYAKNALVHYRSGVRTIPLDTAVHDRPTHPDGEFDACEAVSRVLEKLDPNSARFLREYFFQGRTLEEIAEGCGYSVPYAGRCVKAALVEARKVLGLDPNLPFVGRGYNRRRRQPTGGHVDG